MEHIDILNDFRYLDSLISNLAQDLDRHIAQTSPFEYQIEQINDSSCPIKGVPKELWSKQQPFLLRGAFGSILMETIFPYKLSMLGMRAETRA